MEPNLRITLREIKEHKFFVNLNFDQVKSKGNKVPFVPQDLGKYQHLLVSKGKNSD